MPKTQTSDVIEKERPAVAKTGRKVRVGQRAIGTSAVTAKQRLASLIGDGNDAADIAEAATEDGDQVTEAVDDAHDPLGILDDADSDDDGDDESITKQKGSFIVAEGVDEASPWFKFMFHGIHKAGKTILAASAVDVNALRDVLILDIDGGLKSIRPSGAVKNMGNITSIKVRDYDAFIKVYKAVAAHCKARSNGDVAHMERIAAKSGWSPKKRFRTLIIDTINNIERINFEDVYNNKDVSFTRDYNTGNWDNANRHSSVMIDLFRKLRDLDMNVIFLSHAKFHKDKKSKLESWEPELRGDMKSIAQRNMDMIGYIVQGKPVSMSILDDGDDGDDDAEDALKAIAQKKAKKAAIKADVLTPKSKSGAPIVRTLWIKPVGPFSASSRLTPPTIFKYDDPTMQTIFDSIQEELRTANINAA